MINGNNINVLIAEDDYLVCEEIVRAIKKIGCNHAGTAINGEKAVEMTLEIKPDVVLMDIQMPKLDGLSAARQIQQQCPTPVVILTAHETRELLEQASHVGVGAYITKPPKPEEIERAVLIAIARHKDFITLKNLNHQLQNELETRRKTEEKLKNLLEEKELLLKEIHHRVKNNFMIVSSLLNLQAGQVQDDATKELFKESYNRVNSMALIHEKLYKTSNLSRIDFKNYIESLAGNLVQTYCLGNKVQLITTIENVMLDISQAIPCGLIINELVTNALKHAFPPHLSKTGILEISMHPLADSFEIIIQDNGIGISPDFKIQESKSLGMQLVSLLAEGQLEGNVSIENTLGTRIRIVFPANHQQV
ncbi:MAG TPA: histidine kinase dimerization/phosphoacceptor domain -containing protein [bacterium]|nr:histidine kinase dimerization/phosphoacceptor domain -containing protein [bacterium]HPN42482.1 histidine kinase dimerization/phosphoacceptor domain -containing protein [bacterium]